MSLIPEPAPAIIATQWFNTETPLSLENLRERVIVMIAFQMLCPGCASHALPQAQQVYMTFKREDVAVIGLHSVFEHHAAQTPISLAAFLHEYRLTFPIAVDAPGETGRLPLTMARYAMQGTPTLLLIDRKGHLRTQHFGHIADLRLGAEIMALINEKQTNT